jgi:hypothetical protein
VLGLNVLLEQDGAEARVEGAHTLVLQHLAEATDQAISICRLGDETDTCSLQRAERNIGEELSQRGRGEVDARAVVGGSLISKEVDRLLLEQLVASELERALEEIACSGGTEAGQESTRTLLCDHLADAAEEAPVVCGGVELDSCLDAVQR